MMAASKAGKVVPFIGNMDDKGGKAPKPPRRKRAPNMAKQKGAAAEREVAKLLREWLAPIYAAMGVTPDVIERNLSQSRGGGHDLNGLSWCNIEVKRQEKMNMTAWWRQTIEQTKPGNVPLLVWRQSRQPWRFRTMATLSIGVVAHTAVVELDEEQAHLWLTAQVQTRLLAKLKGTERDWGLTNPYEQPS